MLATAPAGMYWPETPQRAKNCCIRLKATIRCWTWLTGSLAHHRVPYS